MLDCVSVSVRKELEEVEEVEVVERWKKKKKKRSRRSRRRRKEEKKRSDIHIFLFLLFNCCLIVSVSVSVRFSVRKEENLVLVLEKRICRRKEEEVEKIWKRRKEKK